MASFARLILLALLAAPLGALTRPPVTYVLDYGKNHLDQEDYVTQVAGSPPKILHLGKDGPMTHNWGPIRTMGGENQAYGKGTDKDRIPPAEVAERMARLKALTSQLHEAGAERILPYVCLMTIAGHAEHRTGFWEFYDHWDDYAGFGLGPKPTRDPLDWLQRTAGGDLLRFYTYTGDFYPPYEPDHRYVASLASPEWRQWLRAVVTMIGEVGYDGVFVDNGGSYRSYDEASQAGFRDYLAAKYTPAQVEELFGAPLDALALSEKTEGLLWVETQRFWYGTIREVLAELREAGRQARGGEFTIFPNGAHGLKALAYAHLDADYSMFELSIAPQGTNAGRVREQVIEDVTFRHYNRHLFEYLYPQSLDGRVRALILTRGGYPRQEAPLIMNVPTAELGMAEAAAFSGGGGFLLRPDWVGFGPSINKYQGFFDAHPELYDQLQPVGRVAVLASADQFMFNLRTHFPLVEQTLEMVASQQVPVMLVADSQLTAEGLAGYEAVVLPEIRYLSPDAARALTAFAAAGKQVLLIGTTPTHDERGRENAEVAALAGEQGVTVVATPETITERELFEPLRLLAETPTSACGLRTMTYRDPGTGRRIVHLVNYDVQLGRGVEEIDPQENLRLTLPDGWPASVARLISPDREQAVELPIVDRTIALPALPIYDVVELMP